MPNYYEKIRKKKEKEEVPLEDMFKDFLPCKYMDTGIFEAGIQIGDFPPLILGVCQHPDSASIAMANGLPIGRFICSGQKPYPKWCPLEENK